MKDDSKITWDEIEPIWEKWTDIEIPNEINAECERKSEETNKTLLALSMLNVDKGNLDASEAESFERGEKIGAAIASTMMASFILGLEYGARDKDSDRSEEFIDKQAKNALPFLKAAIEPTDLWAGHLIGLLFQSGDMQKDEAIKLATDVAKIILKASVDCFSIGLEHSININQSTHSSPANY